MDETRTHIILSHLLPLAATSGWTSDNLYQAAAQAGENKQAVSVLFPRGITSAISAWQQQLNDQMVARVTAEGWQSDRTRDKIAQCVWTRLQLIADNTSHQDAFRQATRQRLFHPVTVKKDLWRSADTIWNVVGDTSTDYNHYTKRALLSNLLFKTTLSFLGDVSTDYQETRNYLMQQIEQIITRGQTLGHAKPALQKIWSVFERMGVRV
jgi:ubiquinone biosynthesis protein COQ9